MEVWKEDNKVAVLDCNDYDILGDYYASWGPLQ